MSSGNPVQGVVLSTGADRIQATLVASTLVNVHYETLPGNQPKTFRNCVALWPGSQIQWGGKPLAGMPIPKNEEDGDLVLDNPPSNPTGPPYIVAYGTNEKGKSYCATVELAEMSKPGTPFETSLKLIVLNQDSLAVEFTTPPGNKPYSYKNWLALWEGAVAYYYDKGRPPLVNLAGINKGSDTATGTQAMNGLTLTHSTVYTLGYGSGQYFTDLSATLTFKTKPFLYTYAEYCRRFGVDAIAPAVRKQLSECH